MFQSMHEEPTPFGWLQWSVVSINIVCTITVCLGILKSCYLLQLTQQLLNSTQKPESIEALRKSQIDYLLELLRNTFDLTIPMTGLSQSVAKTIPTGVVGLCGSVSSIIGIYQVWAKIK
jgi:hypothetical protein